MYIYIYMICFFLFPHRKLLGAENPTCASSSFGETFPRSLVQQPQAKFESTFAQPSSSQYFPCCPIGALICGPTCQSVQQSHC